MRIVDIGAIASTPSGVTPVGFDTSAYATGTDTLTTGAVSLSIGSNSNRVIYAMIAACVSDSSSSNPAISSVTFSDLYSMTLVGSYAYYSGAKLWIYRYIAPPTGSQHIDVIFDDYVSFVVGAVSLYNVNQTTPNGSYTSAGDVTSTLSITKTGTASSSIVLALGAYFVNGEPTETLTPNSPMVDMYNASAGIDPNSEVSAGGRTAGGGTVTPTWTSSSTVSWGVSAIEVMVP